VVGLLALVCLDLGLRLISSQFFAQLFSLFGKKGVTNPGFEPWSSGSEETDLTIALLEVRKSASVIYLYANRAIDIKLHLLLFPLVVRNS
jgi:hypothetical protein